VAALAREPPTSTEEANPASGFGQAIHEHRSSRADQRVWLERLPNEAATMDLHSFCLDCGAIRSRAVVRGRPLGFFERWIVNLTETLEDHPKYAKLVQVHRHLILRSIEATPEFGDPYSMPFDTQRHLFVLSVQRVRGDLPIELIEEAMPRPPRRSRPAFIDLIPTIQEQEGGSKRKAAGG
jgi:hypothetical protein